MEGRDVLFLFLISGRIMVVVERMELSFSCLWKGHDFNGQQAFIQSRQNGRVHNQQLALRGPRFESRVYSRELCLTLWIFLFGVVCSDHGKASLCKFSSAGGLFNVTSKEGINDLDSVMHRFLSRQDLEVQQGICLSRKKYNKVLLDVMYPF
jgi:hypothetical protein